MGILQHISTTNKSSELSYFDKATSGVIKEETSERPSDGFLTKNKDAETVLNEKFHLIRYRDLWSISKISDVVQIIFNTRARKTFRQGFNIDPNFEASPKYEKNEIEKWIKRCNNNNQSLKEVLAELDKDLNWADDAYMLCLKDYGYNSEGLIVSAEVNEFVRLHPLSVELQLDNNNVLGQWSTSKDAESSVAYVSPFNRGSLTSERYDSKGRENIQAHYKVQSQEGIKYYNKSEILHKSAFNPSLTYGYSPLFSLYQKILILMLQDSYIKKYYGDDKPTKGLLVFNTQNTEKLKATLSEIRAKTDKNPHGFKPIVAESTDGRKPVEYIDMAKTLDEMQYTGTRDEIRQQVGAMYGVSPMFQNDMSTGGGLNNEGLQITVTNEVIQDRQELFNNSFIHFMFVENLGFTNWTVTIKPDIEQDLMAEEQLKAQELLNAKTKLELGLSGRMEKTGDIIFDAGELKLEQVEQTDFNPFSLGESISKASDKVENQEEKKLNSKLDDELKSILEGIDFKKKPTEENLIKQIEGIADKISKNLKKTASSIFNGIYDRFAKDTSKEIGVKYEPTKDDKETVNSLKEDPMYQKSFQNVSDDMSDSIKIRIRQAYEEPNFRLDDLVNSISAETDIAKNRVKRIVRTETAKLSIAAQNKQLEKTGAKYVYNHIGVMDNRTSQSTKDMIRLTKQGVSWEDYIKLATQVSKKYNPKWKINKTAPILHPNQRSKPSFRRVKDE